MTKPHTKHCSEDFLNICQSLVTPSYVFTYFQELKLPFTFMSGHIHELRIHVPWTKLGSEPVVITINTMECILKLKDGAQVGLSPV